MDLNDRREVMKPTNKEKAEWYKLYGTKPAGATFSPYKNYVNVKRTSHNSHTLIIS